MQARSLTIPATDGFELAAQLFEPDAAGPSVRTAVIAPATAVKQRYYEKFATYLAEQGMRAITFDYRGVGGSLRGSVRQQQGTMLDWGEKDLAGVLEFVQRQYPQSRCVMVGHSVGGQLVGLTSRNRLISGMLAVGAQSGYWGHWSAPRRYAMFGVWYGLVPVLTRICSYFPTKMLKMGEDLPAGIALEWARWCRAPGFFVDEKGQPLAGHFEGFRIPIRSFSFEDDGMAPRRAVDALMGFYKEATIDRRHLRPSDVSARQIGHFGFFREKFRDSLWKESAEWLQTV